MKYMAWVRALRFEHGAAEATRLDYLTEVEHAAERIARLDRAIDAGVEVAPEKMRAVIAALQTLRGIAKISAATIVSELGELSRFDRPQKLMGYSGAVSREYSSGGRTWRGGITKTGNSHLRRIVVEAAWAYQHRPAVIGGLKKRQEGQSEAVKEIAWKAQHRLCGRYRQLIAKGKSKPKVVTAVARELLGFIWSIGVTAERAHEETKRSTA